MEEKPTKLSKEYDNTKKVLLCNPTKEQIKAIQNLQLEGKFWWASEKGKKEIMEVVAFTFKEGYLLGQEASEKKWMSSIKKNMGLEPDAIFGTEPEVTLMFKQGREIASLKEELSWQKDRLELYKSGAVISKELEKQLTDLQKSLPISQLEVKGNCAICEGKSGTKVKPCYLVHVGCLSRLKEELANLCKRIDLEDAISEDLGNELAEERAKVEDFMLTIEAPIYDCRAHRKSLIWKYRKGAKKEDE